MTERTQAHTVTIIGGGVVGAAILYTLAHRGVRAVLLEAEHDVGTCASGTNSGVLHTGFDSTPGELETELILRSAQLRPPVLEGLGVPVRHCGAQLVPQSAAEHDTVRALAENARQNGVQVHIRHSDGALLVPGESVTDPVAFTLAMAASAVAAGAGLERNARVVGMETGAEGMTVHTADGRRFVSDVVVNAAGLHADEVARLISDDSFEIYPRKGEFFVFELPGGEVLDHIVLPVPTTRTKGVLVFPTLDGKVVSGPTAVDLEDKADWRVRPDAAAEVLPKAIQQFPALDGLTPIASYAGLRPAGRGSNYLIGPSSKDSRLINVAAIRSTGLTASLGIGDYVATLLSPLGIEVGPLAPPTPIEPAVTERAWWQRASARTL